MQWLISTLSMRRTIYQRLVDGIDLAVETCALAYTSRGRGTIHPTQPEKSNDAPSPSSSTTSSMGG